MGALAELHAEATLAAGIGHNQAPGPLDLASDTMRALSDWMAENPVIETGEQASAAKKLLDSAKSCAADIEDARDKLVRPLNEQVTAINTEHKAVHNTDAKKPGTLDKIVNTLKASLATFIKAEEQRREIEAEAKRLEAEEAARIAREAEEREKEAIANSQAGELGVDVTAVVVEANAAFADFKKADRAATVAERDAHVKIGGGWHKSISLRTKETLVLVSYGKAIKAIGPNDKIRDAILSAARDYRKEKGCLPEGVLSEQTRDL
jgi:hypothetical protein